MTGNRHLKLAVSNAQSEEKPLEVGDYVTHKLGGQPHLVVGIRGSWVTLKGEDFDETFSITTTHVSECFNRGRAWKGGKV